MSKDSKTGFYYSIFDRDCGATTYRAMPYDSKIILDGAHVSPLWFSKEFRFREGIDWMIRETFTEQKALRKLLVVHEKGGAFICLLAKDAEGRCGSSSTEEVVSERVISLSVKDFGIDNRKAKRSIQLLRRNNHNLNDCDPSSIDWLKWAEDSEIMAERAGHFASWELSTTYGKYTDAYITISRCRQKMQSIVCCKAVEQKINNALKAMALQFPMQITIPTFDFDTLESSQSEFMHGNMSLEEFSKKTASLS